MSDFKVGDEVYWIRNDSEQIVLMRGKIQQIKLEKFLTRRRIYFLFVCDEWIQQRNVFQSKQEAIDEMIKRLEELREE